jgi:hypothetical protein
VKEGGKKRQILELAKEETKAHGEAEKVEGTNYSPTLTELGGSDLYHTSVCGLQP